MLDGLTHIPNRRRFDEILEVEWQRSCRDHTSLAMLMIDIDFFKPYNDHYGHVMGDACLVQVAEILSRIVSRPSDLAARYGGEEFVAVLPNTDTDGARHVAQKLRSVVDALLIPHAKSSVADHLTISIGYAAAQCSEQISAGMLLNCADHWLYQAKNDGRNLVEGGNCIQENCHE